MQALQHPLDRLSARSINRRLAQLPALAGLLFAALATTTQAAPQATVDAVVAPAWLERAGRLQPLGLGMEIKHGDRIKTGADSRIYLKLAEGSTVKLGANANLVFFSRSLQPQQRFKGALDVASGAFRFTTDLARRLKGREVSIRVGTATVGIRGTDVWGKSDAERDLVMLIEGHIEVRHGGGAPIDMSEPLTAFVAPKGAAPLPLAAVTAAELQARARETDIETGAGGARTGGKWVLALGSFGDERAALYQYDVARGEGYAPRVVPRSNAGGWNYTVILPGFADEAEAAKTAARLKAVTGIAAVVEMARR